MKDHINFEELEEEKSKCKIFLDSLAEYLSEKLPTGSNLSERVRELQKSPDTRFNQPENSFIYEMVIPEIFFLN